MKSFWQFIKFGLVGVSNTLISEVIYVIIVLLKGNYLFASFVGFMISVLNAYYWSNKYVFKEEQDGEKRVWWKVLAKTYAAYFGGFLLNALLLIVWIDIFHIGNYMEPFRKFLQIFTAEVPDTETIGSLAAEFINLLLVTPMNFLINKFWTYGPQKSRADV